MEVDRAWAHLRGLDEVSARDVATQLREVGPESSVSGCHSTAPSLRQALSCKVCRDWFEDPVALPCGHAICRQCATTWFAEQVTCPSCRSRASKRSAATKADNKQYDLLRATAAAQALVARLEASKISEDMQS